jgi:hypothetical protein
MQPLDPTPLLQPHYRPSSLIRAGPPQCPASVRSPHGFCRLCFSLHIRTTGSRSSTREPGSDSRLLYTGRRLPSCQVSDRLIPEGNEAPGFDEQFCALRCFNGGSLAFVSPDPYLLGVRPRRFDSNAHYRRPLTAAAWSGLKPAPGSRLRRAFLHLPCSLCTVGQFILNLPSVRLRRTHYRTLFRPMPGCVFLSLTGQSVPFFGTFRSKYVSVYCQNCTEWSLT